MELPQLSPRNDISDSNDVAEQSETAPRKHHPIFAWLCILVTLVTPVVLFVERGAESGPSFVLLVGLTIASLHGHLFSTLRAVVMLLLIMFGFSLILTPVMLHEEVSAGATAKVIDRKGCVLATDRGAMERRIGESCRAHLDGDFYFRLNETISREDTQWPLAVFQRSEYVRNKEPHVGFKDLAFGNRNGHQTDAQKAQKSFNALDWYAVFATAAEFGCFVVAATKQDVLSILACRWIRSVSKEFALRIQQWHVCGKTLRISLCIAVSAMRKQLQDHEETLWRTTAGSCCCSPSLSSYSSSIF